MTKRELVEKECLWIIDMFLPGSSNVDIYKEMFARMNDEEFEEWINKLDSGEEMLALYAPNLCAKPKLTIKRNYKVAKAIGHNLFQHIILTDPGTGQVYRTANKHLVGLIPIRRQVQMLEKKKSIPGSSHVIDQRSGQVTGDSKGSRMSAPEIQVNASKGLRYSMIEFMKLRGGDQKAYNAMNRSIIETGSASVDSIMSTYDATVQSNKTFACYLKGMMLQNNLV
ncbi:hypothetical protein [Pseudomonas aeruginosa]|uniref:hypothetical protein n=1 Tax=Pseudomonas aeruginosa TaxID=287 RepID=UPI001CA48A42|nr:hypothetical protein [Pseudomonas aeruginosa]MBW6067608.1 hypothetical protein [Pseudomonas aeruginosa]